MNYLSLITLVLGALVASGCGEARTPVIAGPVAPPTETHNVTAATQSLIAGQANAAVTGDTKTVKAIGNAITQEDKQEIAGSDRWLILAGSLVVAIGLAVMWYLGKYVGGGIVIGGAAMIGCGMFLTALLPYREAIALSGLGIAVVAAAIHFRAYISAAFHMAHGTEHLAGGGVQKLIGKIKARGPGVITRMKALLHHAPLSAVSQTITTTNPTKAL